MKSYKIHFIRNGFTQANLDGRYVGHTDVPLCEDGVKQLQQLKAQAQYPAVDALFSSPLLRCTQTAQTLYPHKETIIIRDLIEYNFGEFEGKTAAELKNYPMFPAWLAGEEGVEPPFGESNAAFASRICNTFSMIVQGLMKTGTTEAAIITHGGVIMTLLTAFGLPQAPMHKWTTPSGCGYTVRIIPSVWMKGQKFEVVEEIPRFVKDLSSI
ncbi:MAG TPA: histidine phosphatase family protein [Clostridia bacterium]|nr:histidine phosphatase family protein [Clostridia bacterium]